MKYSEMKGRVEAIEVLRRERGKVEDAWNLFQKGADGGNLQTAHDAILLVYKAIKGYMDEGVTAVLAELNAQIAEIEVAGEQEGGE